MNTKTAKALRRSMKYHPSQERKYEVVNQSHKVKNLTTGERKSGTIELSGECSRYMYQQLKKEYYSGE